MTAARSEFTSINIKASAKERDAFNLGAQSKRAGTYMGKGKEWYRSNEQNLISWFERGYKAQVGQPGKSVTFAGYHFLLNDEGQITLDADLEPSNVKKGNDTMRTAEQIEGLKADYRTQTYDAYAADQRAQGFEPQDFDEAFAAHLAALDADGATTGDGATAGTEAAKPETAKARKAREVAERKAQREADKAKKAAEKPAPVAKAKKFRPTSEDRTAIMGEAKKLVGDETPRLKLASGGTYDDFLKGHQMDVDGNATAVFDVFTAKGLRAEKPEAVGKIVATIKGGKLDKVAKA